MVTALGVLGGSVTEVADWDQWRAAVKSKPDMLVLVAHTDVVDETPVLEIGDGKILGRQEISAQLSGAAGKPQILLLLGCSAADVTENFQPYPECFRDAGVSIVAGTGGADPWQGCRADRQVRSPADSPSALRSPRPPRSAN